MAALLQAEQREVTADPFSQRDAWRVGGQTLRTFDFELAGQALKATLRGLSRTAPGTAQTLTIEAASDAALLFEGALSWSVDALGRLDIGLAPERRACRVEVIGQAGRDAVRALFVFADVGSAQIKCIDPLLQAGQGAAEVGGRLTAPMPGKVLSIAVKVGDAVKKGQLLAIMEAMKMEHSLHAPADGVVAEVLYAAGDQVSDGVELLKLLAA